jgi:hypothetical protein
MVNFWRTLRTKMGLLPGWAGAHAQDLLFTAALLVVAVGLWWERPSLALIVPASLVCVLLIYQRLRG